MANVKNAFCRDGILSPRRMKFISWLWALISKAQLMQYARLNLRVSSDSCVLLNKQDDSRGRFWTGLAVRPIRWELAKNAALTMLVTRRTPSHFRRAVSISPIRAFLTLFRERFPWDFCAPGRCVESPFARTSSITRKTRQRPKKWIAICTFCRAKNFYFEL